MFRVVTLNAMASCSWISGLVVTRGKIASLGKEGYPIVCPVHEAAELQLRGAANRKDTNSVSYLFSGLFLFGLFTSSVFFLFFAISMLLETYVTRDESTVQLAGLLGAIMLTCLWLAPAWPVLKRALFGIQ